MNAILTKKSTVSKKNSGLCAKYKMHQEKTLFSIMDAVNSEIMAYD